MLLVSLLLVLADPATIVPASPLPEIECLYELSTVTLEHRPQRQAEHIHFWRGDGTVEKYLPAAEFSERWTRDSQGRIAYAKMFHHHHRIVEYTTGDLRALHSVPEWGPVAAFVDLDALAKSFERSESEPVLQHEAERYLGSVNGVETEVVWLPAVSLPARIRQVYPDHVRTLELKEVRPLAESTLDRPDTSGYQHLDYADLGDMEADPFVKSLHAAEGHRH